MQGILPQSLLKTEKGELMKKLCLWVGALSLCTVAFAYADGPAPGPSPVPARISNEIATVKACDLVLRMPYFANFDLTRIYDVAIADSGHGLTVNLSLQATYNDHGFWTEGYCRTNSWFNYDGSFSTCDECQNSPAGPACGCIVAQCDRDPIPAGSTKGITFRK